MVTTKLLINGNIILIEIDEVVLKIKKWGSKDSRKHPEDNVINCFLFHKVNLRLIKCI